MADTSHAALKTVLHAAHLAAGAKMVAFAGYDMPLQYQSGIMAEHLWTRQSAGLFDVSHMGQAFLIGPDHQTTAAALEALCAADISGLKPSQQRYSQLLNDEGGILDDFMVTRLPSETHDGTLYLVVNAACKDADYAHIEARLPADVKLVRKDFALVALQGPLAAAVLESLAPGIGDMAFMTSRTLQLGDIWVQASRSGYTGEDGYEISVQANDAPTLWDVLLADERVKPVGLGARDSLRLEAGLCLYGHDIDGTTSPVEATLAWSIQKRRREEGGFPGAARIQRELRDGPARKRVGLLPEGKLPAREGAAIETEEGETVGIVTSGGFGPSIGRPVAMGYVAAAHAIPGTRLHLVVRGKPLLASVVPLPFVPKSFVKPAPLKEPA
ncbi:MAG: glycine cleavage system aminomethyltransferase GcvT [Beijerinckiaceae bacterium]|nr:glycine cleavage system aminomethyltransferase GcvT [Beijerinckiaceae bacterium]